MKEWTNEWTEAAKDQAHTHSTPNTMQSDVVVVVTVVWFRVIRQLDDRTQNMLRTLEYITRETGKNHKRNIIIILCSRKWNIKGMEKIEMEKKYVENVFVSASLCVFKEKYAVKWHRLTHVRDIAQDFIIKNLTTAKRQLEETERRRRRKKWNNRTEQ